MALTILSKTFVVAGGMRGTACWAYSMTTNGKDGIPSICEWEITSSLNPGADNTHVGLPFFSIRTAASISHAVHEPQSALERMTASALIASSIQRSSCFENGALEWTSKVSAPILSLIN